MGFIAFLREHVYASAAIVVGAVIAVYGAVSEGLDLYRAGLPGWVWLAAGLAIFFAAVVVLLYRFQSRITAPVRPTIAEDDPDWESKLEMVVGRTFLNEEVSLDGRRFLNCDFQNVTLTYDGGPVSIQHCKFGAHRLKTNRPEILRFVHVMVHAGHINSALMTDRGITSLAEFDRQHGTVRKTNPDDSRGAA